MTVWWCFHFIGNRYMQIFQPILRKLCHIPEISTSFCKSPSLIVYWTDKINFEQKKCFEKEKRRIFVDKVQFHFWKKIGSIKSTNSESDVNIFFDFIVYYCKHVSVGISWNLNQSLRKKSNEWTLIAPFLIQYWTLCSVEKNLRILVIFYK